MYSPQFITPTLLHHAGLETVWPCVPCTLHVKPAQQHLWINNDLQEYHGNSNSKYDFEQLHRTIAPKILSSASFIQEWQPKCPNAWGTIKRASDNLPEIARSGGKDISNTGVLLGCLLLFIAYGYLKLGWRGDQKKKQNLEVGVPEEIIQKSRE